MAKSKNTFWRNSKGKVRLIWYIALIALIYFLIKGIIQMSDARNARKEQESKNDMIEGIFSSISEGAGTIAENT